ncbi:MAG TPA: FtsX-like permease family protein, partial [Roseiflexaceae bacterium]|nr:FtsX-like permease family protein [Roseiflexaceae bacterium]
ALRRGLVVLQFAVLAALLATITVVTLQIDHLTTRSLRYEGEQMLLIQASCRRALVDELRRTPGIVGAACAESAPLNLSTTKLVAKRADGVMQTFEAVRVDAGFLELYGLRPLAGRFFRDDAADMASDDAARVQRVVINMTAVRRFSLGSAQAAIGRNPIPGATRTYEVIGVVDDFRLGRYDEEMLPMMYQAEPNRARLISVKLDGTAVATTLERIDARWEELGDDEPIRRRFLSEAIEEMHRVFTLQRWMLGMFCGLALSLAAAGMFGLASATAQERQLEIGVRKAFGAGIEQILQLVLWRFVRLAAVAGVIGCAVAAVVLDRWLVGFDPIDRIEQQWWMFAATLAFVIGVALVAVVGHTWMMARARTTTALRCA